MEPGLGESPLHVALAKENMKMIQALIKAGAHLDLIDYEGNTVFHKAATTNKDIIEVSLNMLAYTRNTTWRRYFPSIKELNSYMLKQRLCFRENNSIYTKFNEN